VDKASASGRSALTEPERVPELSVIIPVYNEGQNIKRVLDDLAERVTTPHEALIVYDFEEDSTLPVVRELQTVRRGIHLIRNGWASGALYAMRTGIAAARGEYVLITMADGSDDLGDVDRMVASARAGADVVAASRYMPGGAQIGGPRLKGLLSRVAGLTLHRLFGVPIHDPTNSFKLYRRSFLRSVDIESHGGFELALELSVKAAAAGRRMAEVPTTWRDRTLGESRFRLSWIPHYLQWYVHAVRTAPGRFRARKTHVSAAPAPGREPERDRRPA
jgi:dolichol-phosphate mannosyltransferase